MNTPNYITAKLKVQPATGKLTNGKLETRLGPVNMRVLITLLEKPGQVVSRADIFDAVWKNQVVSDDTLTRCISDLRGELGKVTDLKPLIETVPKKGYRWIPPVSLPAKHKSLVNRLNWKDSIRWIASVGLITLVVWFAFIGLANYLIKEPVVSVALLPLQSDDEAYHRQALDLEDSLRTSLLQTESFRFISSRALLPGSQNPFSYLSREYGTSWVIEGRLRRNGKMMRISLNLVDARTAMVVHRIVEEHEPEAPQLNAFAERFSLEMAEILLK